MKRLGRGILRFIDKHPLFSFFVVLFLLLDVILAGTFLRKPKAEAEAELPTPKQVVVYTFGDNPTVGTSALVEKSGTVKIVAQTGGVIKAVYIREGSNVGVGQIVAYITSDYAGNNVADLSRQIAEKNATNTSANLQNQLEILNLQRKIAEKGANDASASGGSIVDMQRELTVRQTDTGAAGLRLGSDIGELNVAIASVSAQLGRPVTPIFGHVDRIYVKVGDMVSPGMPLATISNTSGSASARAFISGDLARRIDVKKKASAQIGDQKVELSIRSVSSEPTDGTLFTVSLEIPKAVVALVQNQDGLAVALPVSTVKQNNLLYMPLDGVYQTQTGAYVFIIRNDTGQKVAKAQKVRLGEVVGSYVAVVEGLSSSDSAILSRNVIDGDRVEAQ